MSIFGYTGKRLDVDLANGTSKVTELSQEYLGKYVGGKGLAAKILFDELPKNCDPLSEENLLVFATGPLTGTLAPLSGRTIVATKSPLTGIWVDSNAGGFLGPEIKRAGYDVIVFKGRSKVPVTLLIENDSIKFFNAEDLWGINAEETHKKIKACYSVDYRIACIGPSGENLIPVSSIISEMRAFGRGGVGAVMGSKNLKAIIVHGNKPIKVWNPEDFLLINKESYNELAINTDTGGGRQRYGTNVIYSALNELGVHPVKNFQSSINEHTEALSEDVMREDLVEKDKACFACPIACSKYSKVKKGKYKGEYSEGPEYENTWAFGSQCGNGDYGAVITAEHLCDMYGIDSISVGNAIGFAMECVQRGILTKEEIGYDLEFGNSEHMLQMIHQIGKGEGVGKLLGQGVKKASEILGQGSKRFAMHVKGLELPAYDPRAAYAMGLAYATSDRGGCHLRSWPIAMEALQNRGRIDPYSIEFKAEYVKNEQDLIAIVDSIGLCLFATFALTPRQIVRLMYNITGFDSFKDTQNVLKAGERIYNLTRLFNLQEGVELDTLPPRLLEEGMPNGPAQGNCTPLKEMLSEYYFIRGWNEQGAPFKETLERLDL